MDNLEHLNALFDLIEKNSTGTKDLVREKLAEALTLGRKIRDKPYAYDEDGKAEFEFDLVQLVDLISITLSLYEEKKP